MIFFLWLSLLLMELSLGILNIKFLTIPGSFYLSYLMIIFLPSFFVYSENNCKERNIFLFSVLSVLFSVPAGIIFANFLLKFKKAEIRKYYFIDLIGYYHPGRTELVFFLLLFFSILILINFTRESYFSTGAIPIISLLRGSENYSSIILLREESFKLLNSPFYYCYYLLRSFLFPILVS